MVQNKKGANLFVEQKNHKWKQPFVKHNYSLFKWKVTAGKQCLELEK